MTDGQEDVCCRKEKEGGSLNKKWTGRAVRGETKCKLCLALM